jgi:hypothetical protein
MKNAVLHVFLFFLCVSHPLFAKCVECGDRGESVYPLTETLPQNGILILEGYGSSQKIIEGLNIVYPAFLVSDNHKVKLKIKQINVGGHRLTQAIVAPETTLKIGNTYHLLILNPEGEEEFFEKGNGSKASWHIVEALNAKPILWDKMPIVGRKVYAEYGCGPASYVCFDFAIKTQQSYFIRATLVDVDIQTKMTYYILPFHNTIAIGHDMCSGEFRFREKGAECTIQFDVVDLAGNITPWQYMPIEFTAPSVYASEE